MTLSYIANGDLVVRQDIITTTTSYHVPIVPRWMHTETVDSVAPVIISLPNGSYMLVDVADDTTARGTKPINRELSSKSEPVIYASLGKRVLVGDKDSKLWVYNMDDKSVLEIATDCGRCVPTLDRKGFVVIEKSRVTVYDDSGKRLKRSYYPNTNGLFVDSNMTSSVSCLGSYFIYSVKGCGKCISVGRPIKKIDAMMLNNGISDGFLIIGVYDGEVLDLYAVDGKSTHQSRIRIIEDNKITDFRLDMYGVLVLSSNKTLSLFNYNNAFSGISESSFISSDVDRI